jgi:integrase
MRPLIQPSSWISYEYALRVHLLPAFGERPLRELSRAEIRALVSRKLEDGLARDTVRILHATLRAMLASAVDDELIPSNPARGLGRTMRLAAGPRERQQDVRALDREQLAAVIAQAREAKLPAERRMWPLFLCLARSGLTVGEGFALQWPDLDFDRRMIQVTRSFAVAQGRLGPPKRCRSRTVDMSRQLASVLRGLRSERQLETRVRRWPSMPPWVFCTRAGTRLDYSSVRRAFANACRRAGLEGFTPHSLRHTFASQLLQQGESPAYVQRQLGHASIKLTVDTYGRWLPMSNHAAVDRLDVLTR